jgi:predicted GH43/DUF377 family glycosyl hydrolase
MAEPLIRTLDVTLGPDPSRTVIRPFLPGDPAAFANPEARPTRIIRRVLGLGEKAVADQLNRTWASLDERHRDVPDILQRQFEAVAKYVPHDRDLTERDRMLIGAYLSAEYSFEAAALFNPSVVAHPDQAGCPNGATRFIVSLRGIGEGHLSSVAFRTGLWNADGTVTLDPSSPTAVPPIIEQPDGWHDDDTIQLDCRGSREPSETVLFPIVESQARGIEDLRLTWFVSDEFPSTYLGTYTALGAKGVRQEMLQTSDFRVFKMHPVKGALADAKGLALFPRKVGDCYMAVSRHDNENLWLARSSDLFTWEPGDKLLEPEAPWELTQIGNCGSPIEIDEGWLLLTHGVGVVRNYCMGAVLLDKEDPGKVIGRLADPLIEPQDDDRDGYVPNVVYSCGAMARGRELLLPYAVADEFTRFAVVSIDRLLAAMTKPA